MPSIRYGSALLNRNAACLRAAVIIIWDDAYTVHPLSGKPGSLKNILDACTEAGNPDRVFLFCSTSKITFPGAEAGTTFPYGKDPRDRNIRIAPTFPSLEELETAIEVLCLCVQLTGIERILEGCGS